jgi:hypothetical protein
VWYEALASSFLEHHFHLGPEPFNEGVHVATRLNFLFRYELLQTVEPAIDPVQNGIARVLISVRAQLTSSALLHIASARFAS